jgi:hypothetical protein
MKQKMMTQVNRILCKLKFIVAMGKPGYSESIQKRSDQETIHQIVSTTKTQRSREERLTRVHEACADNMMTQSVSQADRL